jgi:hypothetical protein
LAKLSINWETCSEIAPSAVTTGESAEAAPGQPQAMVSERPMMVYVMSDDPTDKETRSLDAVAFKKDQVAIGAKFFRTVKMTAGDAAQDRILKDAGRKTPRMVFLRRDYTVANVLEGSELSGGSLVKAMQQVVSKEFESPSFDTMVKEYVSLLADLDRLESKKTALEDQKRRLAEKPNKSKEAKIARDEAEYNAEREAWEARETKLKTMKLKGVPETPANEEA